MKERIDLLQAVDQYCFALNEVVLYLDTHPTDGKALAYYQQCQKLVQQAQAEYTAAYGPLNSGSVNVTNQWTWVNSPWPWEMEV